VYNSLRNSDIGVKEHAGNICSKARGQFTIPAEIRREMGIKDGDVFSLVRLGDALIAIRKKLVVPEIAEAIEAIMQEEGVTLEDLLEGLEKQREIYVREKYGIET
jgi:AbrB family looped-hinge helix DNA binding protein